MSFPRQFLPVLACSAGGTLARASSTCAGHFPSSSCTSLGAPCSVLLTRDARSSRDWGLSVLRDANRAACMRTKRQGTTIPCVPAASSLRFHEAAHQLRTHHTNRNQALASLGLGRGAAGRVQRFPSRLSITVQSHNIAHSTPLFCNQNAIGTAFRSGGIIIRRSRNGQDG